VLSKVLESGILEDLGISELMKDVDRNRKVARDTIIKKLNNGLWKESRS
jgi:hypothetical protein